MKVSISTIRDWFRTGLKPTQSEFWSTWDSFWHKDEKIPITSVHDLQENLDTKVTIAQYEAEKNNIQNTSFKNVGDGKPNVNTEKPAYREGKIGVGEPNPIETVDVIGSAKFQYTYEDGSISRTTLGGENTNSEIGLPSGFIKTNTLNFFPDSSVHPSTQGYFYTGDISSISPITGKLSTGIGIANFTNTKFARTTYFPSSNNGNPDSEFAGIFESRHEDSNNASLQVFSKGTVLGTVLESYLFLRAINSNTSAKFALTPRLFTFSGGLLQLKDYAGDTIVRNYTHNDDEARTGTPATTVGNLNALGIDNNGNVAKIVTYKESGIDEDELLVEIGDLSGISNGTKIIIDNEEEIITLESNNVTNLKSSYVYATDLPLQNINSPKSLTTKEYVDSKVLSLPREYYATFEFDGLGNMAVTELKNTFKDITPNASIGDLSGIVTQGSGDDTVFILNMLDREGTNSAQFIYKDQSDNIPRNIEMYPYDISGNFKATSLTDTTVNIYSSPSETFLRIRIYDNRTGAVLTSVSQLNGTLRFKCIALE